jgi:hypothetical protein
VDTVVVFINSVLSSGSPYGIGLVAFLLFILLLAAFSDDVARRISIVILAIRGTIHPELGAGAPKADERTAQAPLPEAPADSPGAARAPQVGKRRRRRRARPRAGDVSSSGDDG